MLFRSGSSSVLATVNSPTTHYDDAVTDGLPHYYQLASADTNGHIGTKSGLVRFSAPETILSIPDEPAEQNVTHSVLDDAATLQQIDYINAANNDYPVANFSATAANATRTVQIGTHSTTDVITIAPLRGFSTDVDVTLPDNPTGITLSVNNATITDADGTTTLTITSSSDAVAGEYDLILTFSASVTGGTISHDLIIKLTVTA